MMNTSHIICALLVILLILVIAKATGMIGENYRYRYAQWMDQACMDNDCSTEEGKQKAVEQCKSKFMESGLYVKSACEHPDPEIRAQACAEPCDINSVSSYITENKMSEATAYTAASAKALEGDLASQVLISKAILEQIAKDKAAKSSTEPESKEDELEVLNAQMNPPSALTGSATEPFRYNRTKCVGVCP
jgi:hypothetical protein